MENSLAYELLKELKNTNRRLFILSIIEFIIILSMIVAFFIYESQYSYESLEGVYQYTEESSLISQNLDIGE